MSTYYYFRNNLKCEPSTSTKKKSQVAYLSTLSNLVKMKI